MTIATQTRVWGGVLGVLTFVLLTGGSAARGRQGDAKLGERPEGADGALGAEVAEYAVVAHSEPEADLTLKAEPALRWTNPVRETDGGLVFLWLGRGRPEAISCFYRVRFEGRLVEAHEFLSLAPVGLTATLRGRTVWSPPGPGLEFRPFPVAPRPAATPAERFRQLRAWRASFACQSTSTPGRPSSDCSRSRSPALREVRPMPALTRQGSRATRRRSVRLRTGDRP